MPKSIAFRRKIPSCPACGDSYGFLGVGGFYYICSNDTCPTKEPDEPVAFVWWTSDFKATTNFDENNSPYKDELEEGTFFG